MTRLFRAGGALVEGWRLAWGGDSLMKHVIPLYIRVSLIKKLYKSLEYRHVVTKEIVRQLAKVFTILRLRAKVQNILGNYLAYY